MNRVICDWRGGMVSVLVLCGGLVFGQSAGGGFPVVRNTEEGEPAGVGEVARGVGVPEGFGASLFAGEPDVRQPIGMAMDERGRLWVAENYTYADQSDRFDLSFRDRVVILEDVDQDGRFDKRKVFWDEGERLTSVEVGFGGVWVLCAPNLLFIPDADRDDVPDGEPKVVLDGWNYAQVQHNVVNGLRWGPDGWLYGRQGILATSMVGKPGAGASQRTKLNCSIWRYHPTREVFEVVGHGTTNSWGFDYDEHGEMFFINTVIGHLFHLVPGAHYERMYGADFNPHLYELMGQTADHYHWDTGEKWSDIRQGVSDTTAAAGGGHAHSGLMIYQGDDWPERYRGSVFAINFHGRRFNQDRLERYGAGYRARHGEDMVFFSDAWFRGVELMSNAAGGVFVADWSDTGECHDSDGVHRTSGRIFEVRHGERKREPVEDLSGLSDSALVELQLHDNAWHVRQGRRLLQERAARGRDVSAARDALLKMFAEQTDVVRQLRAMWCLYGIGAVDSSWWVKRLDDPNEHVRVWAIRALTDGAVADSQVIARLTSLAAGEGSGLVRLYLASGLQRLAIGQRWGLAEALAGHAELEGDRSLSLMIWYGIEPAVLGAPARSIALAKRTPIGGLRRHIARRLTAEIDAQGEAVDALVGMLGDRKDAAFRLDVLNGMNAALAGRRKAAQPKSWAAAFEALEAGEDALVKAAGRQLGVVFGDGRSMGELRELVVNEEADAAGRQGALRTLARDGSGEMLDLVLKSVGDRLLGTEAIRGLAFFDDPRVSGAILGVYPGLSPEGREAAIGTLSSRLGYAKALVGAVREGRIDAGDISAFHARQIHSFGDEAVNQQLEQAWGVLRPSDGEKQAQISKLRSRLTAERLAQADLSNGRAMFQESCAKCHVLFGEGGRVGPDLTGSNRDNLTYLLENVLDPSATMAEDFKVSVIEMKDGRLLTGVVVQAAERMLSVQTQEELIQLDRSEVDSARQQQLSLMPDGLLEPLTEDQVRDLFGYLSGVGQVALPAGE